MINCLKAEIQKMKHSKLLLIHCLIPVSCAIVFLGYFIMTKQKNVLVMYTTYFEVIAILLPFISCVMVGLCLMLEEETGTFQIILGSSVSRVKIIMAKLFLLLCLCLLALILAAILFTIGIVFIVPLSEVKLFIVLQAVLILFFTNIWVYPVAIFIYLKSGMVVTTVYGGCMFLISALLLTGLGQIIWVYVPPAWAARYIVTFLSLSSQAIEPIMNISFLAQQLVIAQTSCVIFTIICFVTLIFWIKKWEGRTITI